jgi:hypothetical protein
MVAYFLINCNFLLFTFFQQICRSYLDSLRKRKIVVSDLQSGLAWRTNLSYFCD